MQQSSARNVVVFVNGVQTAGKDTAVEYMRSYLDDQGWDVDVCSSIDCVVDMLEGVGIEIGAKTEADRNLLATVGAAVENHGGFRSRMTADTIVNHLRVIEPGDMPQRIVFVHVREILVMDAIQSKVQQRRPNVEFKRVYVYREVRNIASNPSDQGAKMAEGYDHKLMNTATLRELQQNAHELCETMLGLS